MKKNSKNIILATIAFFVIGGGLFYIFDSLDTSNPMKIELTSFYTDLLTPDDAEKTFAPIVHPEKNNKKGVKKNIASDNTVTNSQWVLPSQQMKDATQLGKATNSSLYADKEKTEKGFTSTNGGGNTNNMIVVHQRRTNNGDYSNAISNNNISVLGANTTLMSAPVNSNGWALLDPEPIILDQEDKIVPVGDGFYFIGLLALLYGVVRTRRLFR